MGLAGRGTPTGGMVPAEKELIPAEIFRQAGVAIGEAAHLVLVVDARAGVVPLDEELAQMLRRTGKPLALAVNKIDSLEHAPLAAEFHRLGVRDAFPVSAEHGLGVDDLLDHVTADFGSAGVPFASLNAGSPAGLEFARPQGDEQGIRLSQLRREVLGLAGDAGQERESAGEPALSEAGGTPALRGQLHGRSQERSLSHWVVGSR